MFEKSADVYDRYVGRYSRALARALIAATEIKAGDRVLDVGCGPGALTAEVIGLVGAGNVVAVDASEAFVEAYRHRYPGIRAEVAYAESMPFEDSSVDVAIAQLVVQFMTDAHAGVGEMKRITRSAGTLAAATWDYRAGMTFIRKFWDAAAAVNPGEESDEKQMRYCTPDELSSLWSEVGLTDVKVGPADVKASYDSFGDLWDPLEGGIGPAGSYLVGLAPDRQARIKAEYQRLLGVGDEPFELTARAWVVTGRVP